MYYCFEDNELYTVSKEGRFCCVKTFDLLGEIQSEQKLKFTTDIFKRKREHSTVIPTLKYKNVIWIKNAIFDLSGEAHQLEFPDDFDWECECQIYKNGAFLIGTDYNERNNTFRSYVLGSFEPNVIHSGFPSNSEINALSLESS